MKDNRLESLLLGARLDHGHSSFTKIVMRQIKSDATFARHIRSISKQPKRSLFMKLRALHGASLMIAVVAAAVIFSGIVYASVRFAPDFIQLFDKKINEQGRIEYNVPAFAECQDQYVPKHEAFAVKPTVQLDDAEVKKILQAKCELMSINKFSSDTWPTYGDRKEWRDGDTIYYTRPDILGSVKSIGEREISIENFGGVESTAKYATFQNQPLQAFERNRPITLGEIRSGDFVFVIERVGEKYFSKPLMTDQHPAPRDLGAVAVVKMSFPREYYHEKQAFIYEIEPCHNNIGETCPKEYQASVDVFPRGSEGATNPSLRTDNESSLLSRTINGAVIDIQNDRLVLKSNKGNNFTVWLPKQLIDSYNTDISSIYRQGDRIDASRVVLREGSWISIIYQQQPKDNARDIQLKDIFKVYLLTDLRTK